LKSYTKYTIKMKAKGKNTYIKSRPTRCICPYQLRSLCVLQLMLTVQNLLTAAESQGDAAAVSGYECVFAGHGTTLRTPVTRIERIDAANTTLRCETPPAKHLPLFPAGKGERCLALSDAAPTLLMIWCDVMIYITCARKMAVKPA